MMKFIEIKNINKSFNNRKVLDNINISINQGEFITLLGPSGCGKTTLLRSIVGLEEVDSGNIYLEGKDITNKIPNERNIGMVFQQYALFPTMNVYNNIAFGLRMKDIPKNKIKEEIYKVLDLVDLKGNERKYPFQLSGGEQQRVALARCLVTNPKVMLFDEPFSAIDAKLRRSLQIRIKEIHRKLKMTSIFVTHDQEEAMRMSDKIILFNKGKIEQEGSPINLYSNPSSSFVASFIGNYNMIKSKDFNIITNEEYIESDIVAVRPEIISISIKPYEFMEPENYYMKGKIIGLIPQGNVIRYNIDIKGIIVDVDLLFDLSHKLQLEQLVYLKIKKNDIIYYNS